MADAFLIDINQELLRAAMSKGDKREWTPAEIRAWLIEHDFQPQPNGWVCEEDSLRALNKNEYKVIRQIV